MLKILFYNFMTSDSTLNSKDIRYISILFLICIFIYLIQLYRNSKLEIPKYNCITHHLNSTKMSKEEFYVNELYVKYLNDLNRLEHNKKILKLIYKKIDGSKIFNRSNLDNLIKMKESIEYDIQHWKSENYSNSLKTFFSFYQYKPDYENFKLLLKQYSKKTHDFFGNDSLLISEFDENIIFFQNKVFILNSSTQYIKVYDYKSIEFGTYKNITWKNNYSHYEEYEQTKWLHQRKDGGRDLRYSENYLLYGIRVFHVYFSVASKIHIIIEKETQYNKLRDLFCLIVKNEICLENNEKIKLLKKISNALEFKNNNDDKNKIQKTEDLDVSVLKNDTLTELITEKITFPLANNSNRKPSLEENNKVLNNNDLNFNSEIDTFLKGDFVKHHTFGIGKIIKSNEYESCVKFYDHTYNVLNNFLKRVPKTKIYKGKKDICLNTIFKSSLYGTMKIFRVYDDFVELITDKGELFEYTFDELNYIEEVSKYYSLNYNYYIEINNKKGYLYNIKSYRILLHNANKYVIELNFDEFDDVNSYILEDKAYIASYFTKDYYFEFEVYEILQNIKYSININFNISSFMKKMHFHKIQNIFLSNKYSSLDDYILHVFSIDDIYRYDYNIDKTHYFNIIERLQKKFYCVKYEEGIYFTTNKLNHMGLSYEEFMIFEKKLNHVLNQYNFITINQLSKIINCKVIDCFKNNNILKNIILCYDEFKIKKLSNQLFIYNSKFKNKSLFLEDLIKEILDKLSNTSITYDNIIFILNETYALNFDYYSFCDVLEESNFDTLYNSNEMEKIYKNIDYYYKEVFGNDK